MSSQDSDDLSGASATEAPQLPASEIEFSRTLPPPFPAAGAPLQMPQLALSDEGTETPAVERTLPFLPSLNATASSAVASPIGSAFTSPVKLGVLPSGLNTAVNSLTATPAFGPGSKLAELFPGVGVPVSSSPANPTPHDRSRLPAVNPLKVPSPSGAVPALRGRSETPTPSPTAVDADVELAAAVLTQTSQDSFESQVRSPPRPFASLRNLSREDDEELASSPLYYNRPNYQPGRSYSKSPSPSDSDSSEDEHSSYAPPFPRITGRTPRRSPQSWTPTRTPPRKIRKTPGPSPLRYASFPEDKEKPKPVAPAPPDVYYVRRKSAIQAEQKFGRPKKEKEKEKVTSFTRHVDKSVNSVPASPEPRAAVSISDSILPNDPVITLLHSLPQMKQKRWSNARIRERLHDIKVDVELGMRKVVKRRLEVQEIGDWVKARPPRGL